MKKMKKKKKEKNEELTVCHREQVSFETFCYF